MTERKRPTAAADWKQPQPQLVTLPSGNSALLRKPPLFLLLKTGRMPESVRAVLEKNLHLEIPTTDEMLLATEWLVSESFVEPRVTLQPQDGAVCIDDLDDDDKQAVIERFGLSLRI